MAPDAVAARQHLLAPTPEAQVNIWANLRALQHSGQNARSFLGRRIALSVWSEVFNFHEFDRDDIFLEPFLFSVGLNRAFAAEIPGLIGKKPFSSILLCREPCVSRVDSSYPNIGSVLKEFELVSCDNAESLARCMEVLRTLNLGLFEVLFFSCKYIRDFRSEMRNSFAHELFPGVAFINMAGEVTRMSILEDLSHQAMHCVFSDIELSEDFLYVKPPATPLSEYMDGPSSQRTLSVVHHSALTESSSIITLTAALQSEALDEMERVEAFARLGFLVRKLAIDWKYISTIRALDEGSYCIYSQVVSCAQDVVEPLIVASS